MCSIDIINANILAKKPVAEDKNASLRCFDGRIMKPTARRGVVVADGTLVHASEQENPTRSGLHVLLGRAFSASWFASIWRCTAVPNLSPSVEFQLVFNRKTTGIFSHDIEVLAPVPTDSWREARLHSSTIANCGPRPVWTGPAKPILRLTENDARALLVHCAQEMAHLAAFLPELSSTFKGER